VLARLGHADSAAGGTRCKHGRGTRRTRGDGRFTESRVWLGAYIPPPPQVPALRLKPEGPVPERRTGLCTSHMYCAACTSPGGWDIHGVAPNRSMSRSAPQGLVSTHSEVVVMFTSPHGSPSTTGICSRANGGKGSIHLKNAHSTSVVRHCTASAHMPTHTHMNEHTKHGRLRQAPPPPTSTRL
jgi:hypothetical protein